MLFGAVFLILFFVKFFFPSLFFFLFLHFFPQTQWKLIKTEYIHPCENLWGWLNYSIYNIIKVYALQWSPMSTHLSTWEQYSQTAGQEPGPNLHIWNTGSGKKKHLAGMYIFLKNHPPLKWAKIMISRLK